MVQASGTAVIQHRDSGEIYEISADDLLLESVSSHERDMGPEVLWVARIDHPELGDLEWSITEYPVGAISGTPQADLNGHELHTNFSFEIDYSDPDPDDDDDDVVPLPTSITNGDTKEMAEWFHAHYEDPANSLPYSSADGGYQWINGGPYEPLEVLQEEFDRVYSFDTIEAAAQAIVDEDGTYEWTPRDDAEADEDRVLRAAARLDRHLPLAERLVFNEESGTFGVVAALIGKPDLLQATLSQIQDALNDCLASQSNGLSEQDHEVRKLRRMLSIYANDPQRIEMDATSVRNSLLAKMRSEELPHSEEIQDLVNALRDAAQGLRATDPNIAENRRILQSATMSQLTPEALGAIEEAAPVLEAITEGDLHEQMRDDLAVLAEYDGQLSGVTRSDGLGHDEVARIVGRTARMLLAIRKSSDTISKLEASTPIKVGKIIGALTILVSAGAKMFSFLFL